MGAQTRLANEAWEALFRAQVLLMRRFAADDVWAEVSQNEYDVLYTLAKAPDGLSMVEVNQNILMTQGGVSRLISRLVDRGLIDRDVHHSDRRASRLQLTAEGRRIQRQVGRRHAAAVATVMQHVLEPEQMIAVRDLGDQIITRIGTLGTVAE
ncbi:MAG: MarR family transcriptional regulator [Propionicimonas sp.]|nr:MarR family transcriptional regulator [Propionicimonas sp.]